jgi:hypothetical protein
MKAVELAESHKGCWRNIAITLKTPNRVGQLVNLARRAKLGRTFLQWFGCYGAMMNKLMFLAWPVLPVPLLSILRVGRGNGRRSVHLEARACSSHKRDRNEGTSRRLR